ncbi:hypothetical protein B9Z55_017479 [Caenorhabditis nigoni]|uniref:Uncharacterized protein n=1 Tax=Caenorhabditis nigoni TaxID=1611254 RepID=A0A2G5T9L9_9PELO|nr:hypothetical protein B9Z55_017479 [Caenorhabditis nigoni]
MRIFLIAAIAVLAISAHDHHHGGGGSDHHHSTSDSGHHHHHGGGGGDHHHHHHHHSIGSDYSSSNYDSSSSGSSGGIGLGQLLFGGLFRRPSYYGYGNYNRGYCRVAQFVDYVGQTPRYYCDCPPYPPNYQWNQCVPMANYAYGKK